MLVRPSACLQITSSSSFYPFPPHVFTLLSEKMTFISFCCYLVLLKILYTLHFGRLALRWCFSMSPFRPCESLLRRELIIAGHEVDCQGPDWFVTSQFPPAAEPSRLGVLWSGVCGVEGVGVGVGGDCLGLLAQRSVAKHFSTAPVYCFLVSWQWPGTAARHMLSVSMWHLSCCWYCLPWFVPFYLSLCIALWNGNGSHPLTRCMRCAENRKSSMKAKIYESNRNFSACWLH